MKYLLCFAIMLSLFGCDDAVVEAHRKADDYYSLAGRLVWKTNLNGIQYSETFFDGQKFIVTRNLRGEFQFAGTPQ